MGLFPKLEHLNHSQICCDHLDSRMLRIRDPDGEFPFRSSLQFLCAGKPGHTAMRVDWIWNLFGQTDEEFICLRRPARRKPGRLAKNGKASQA